MRGWPFAYEASFEICKEYDSGGLAASGIIQASPTRLYQLVIFNGSGSAQYIQLFNGLTVPADTALPSFPPIRVATLTTVPLDLGFLGALFTTGLVWSNSSSAATKTLGSADCWVRATYR